MGVRIRPRSFAGPPSPRPAAARRAVGAAAISVVDVVGRGIALWLLYLGLLAFSGWLGRTVLAPGAWLETDNAIYRALNGVAFEPLTAALLTALNDPGPDYFAVIVVILAYCAWRRRAALPAAALAIGVALALGQLATKELPNGGDRERPFLHIAEARTPIMSCHGTQLVAIRGQNGPTARCDGSPADLVGLDWREIWVQFPSFPSGHMRETAALGMLLVAFWPASWPYTLGYLGIMAFSRVHLGAHYPSDVLGGTVMGLWAGGLTLLGLDLVRRLFVYLHRVPPLGAAWDWVFIARVPGRPDRDPLPARLMRIAAVVAAAQAALYGLGYASTTAQAGQIYSVLQNVDYFAYSQLTARFDPAWRWRGVAVAPALYAALGPAGYLNTALVLATLAVWLRWRALGVLAALLLLAAAGALALELHWAGGQWFQRLPPFTQVNDAPIPPEWRAAWLPGWRVPGPTWLAGVPWPAATSFPSRHALLVAALAGVFGAAGRWVAAPAQAVALAAALAAVYFGAAWLTDALAGYLLGNLAAAAARYALRQFLPGVSAPAGDDRAQVVAARLARAAGMSGGRS